MPKIHKNKEEIRAYYETHTESLSDLSKRFKVPLRTLCYWSKSQGWKKAAAIQNIAVEVVQKDIVKKEFGTILMRESESIKEKIRSNLGDTAFKIDSMLLENMLEESTEKILLGAMSINYIQNNIALATLIAKDEMMRLKQATENKPDVMVVAAAEKVQKMFLDMKSAFFGKDVVLNTSSKSLDFENMSEAELNALLKDTP